MKTISSFVFSVVGLLSAQVEVSGEQLSRLTQYPPVARDLESDHIRFLMPDLLLIDPSCPSQRNLHRSQEELSQLPPYREKQLPATQFVR